MTAYESYFQDQNGPEPWAEDGELIEYLVRWLETTCVLKGHQIRPAERIVDPERWRKVAAWRLAQGRNRDSITVRDRVLRVIAQTEPELAAELPTPQEQLPLPTCKIAESR